MRPHVALTSMRRTMRQSVPAGPGATILTAKAVRAILAHVARLESRKARVDQAKALWPYCWRCRYHLVNCQCPLSDMESWHCP